MDDVSDSLGNSPSLKRLVREKLIYSLSTREHHRIRRDRFVWGKLKDRRRSKRKNSSLSILLLGFFVIIEPSLAILLTRLLLQLVPVFPTALLV